MLTIVGILGIVGLGPHGHEAVGTTDDALYQVWCAGKGGWDGALSSKGDGVVLFTRSGCQINREEIELFRPPNEFNASSGKQGLST